MSNPYPTIEFTFNLPDPTGDLPFDRNLLSGYTAQYSTWISASKLAGNNAAQKNGRTITLYGADATYLKKLIDDGKVSGSYRHVPYPEITSINPNSDYVSGLSYITITGTGFSTGITSVAFGDRSARYFVINSDTQLTTSNFPATAGVVNVAIRNRFDVADGAVGTEKEFTFNTKTIQGTMTSFSVDYSWIANGPDGYLWGVVGDKFHKIDPTTGDSVANYTAVGSSLSNVITGPDGNLWATSNSVLWKCTPDGVTTSYATTFTAIRNICAGPDGNIWAAGSTNKVAKITTSGVATYYTITNPWYILGGPDGNLFAVPFGGNQVLKINTSGELIGDYSFTGAVFWYLPVVGVDGNIWISDNTGPIWKITTSGIGTSYPVGSSLYGVAVGGDGYMYSFNNGIDIKKISTSGAVTSLAGFASAPNNVVTGPDGNVWWSTSGALQKLS